MDRLTRLLTGALALIAAVGVLSLGGTHAGIQKWKHKLEEAKEQENFPVKV